MNFWTWNWYWKLFFESPQLKVLNKVSTNSLRIFIWIQKFIEFHLPCYEIPKLSSSYSIAKNHQFNTGLDIQLQNWIPSLSLEGWKLISSCPGCTEKRDLWDLFRLSPCRSLCCSNSSPSESHWKYSAVQLRITKAHFM